MTDTETFYISHDPLTGQPIDPAPPVVLIASPPARARKIIAEVAAAYELTPEDLTGPRRFKYLMEPRWLAMRRIREELGYSFPHIGRLFNRDHSTVVWAIRGGRPYDPASQLRKANEGQERAA
jgi:hypothetical protein